MLAAAAVLSAIVSKSHITAVLFAVLCMAFDHLISPKLSIDMTNADLREGKSHSLPGKSIEPSLCPRIYEFPLSSKANSPEETVEELSIVVTQAHVPLLYLFATYTSLALSPELTDIPSVAH